MTLQREFVAMTVGHLLVRSRTGAMMAVIMASVAVATPIPAAGQSSEQEVLRLVRSEGLQAARERVKESLRRAPGNEALLYFDALLEPDGEAARDKYQTLVRKDPDSAYGMRARMKLGKYYFALGSYLTARDNFLECRKRSSDAEMAAEAAYFAAWSLYAAGRRREAVSELRELVRDQPGSPYARMAAGDLKEWTADPSRLAEPSSTYSMVRDRYTLQVGAFTERGNALSQRDYLRRQGLTVEIQTRLRAGRLFYLVWVGRFGTEEEAQRFGEEFKRRFKKPFRIVEVTPTDSKNE